MSIKDRLSPKQRRGLYKFLNLLPDKVVVKLQYYASLGRWPDLKNPKRYTEKLVWYKLNYRVPLMTQCADKYRVRFYLREKGYEEYMPSLYQVVDKVEDINFDELPDSFAIKCNNGSGTNIFIKDKSVIRKEEIVAEAANWKEVNTISVGREWAYVNIEPKIVVEELLVSNDGTQVDDLNDYKIMCFNGTPRVIWVDTERHTSHKRNFYDLDWNKLPVKSDCPHCTEDIPKPYGLDKMIEIATDISKDFPFVRVDFYSLNQRIYIGELTFYPWSGCVQYDPDSFDFELGSYFDLPKRTIVE